MFEDWFSGIDAGGYEVAAAYGGPQEDVVFQQFSQTGTLPVWEEDNALLNAALSSASADYDARLAADLQAMDAQTVNATLSSSGSDYAARLAADLAKFGAAALGGALNSSTTAAKQTIQNGAAMITPRLQPTRALFDKNQTTNTGFGATQVLIGGVLLIVGAYAVAKLA